MARSTHRKHWLEQVAQLLAGSAKEQRPIRRLSAEHLERRQLLCATGEALLPLSMSETEFQTLCERAAAMGPQQPALVQGDTQAAGDGSSAEQGGVTADPALADQYFARFAGQGEGEGEGSSSGSGGGGASGSGSGGGESSGSGSGGGEGSGSGSGSGSGAGSGSGSGDGSGSGSGAGSGAGSGSGSGTGQGSGSGSGEGSGSGSGETSGSGSGEEEEPNERPVIHASYSEIDGVLYFSGVVSDDGNLNGLTVRFGDLIVQDVRVNADGTFSFQVNCPSTEGNYFFYVLDDQGLSSMVNQDYYIP